MSKCGIGVITHNRKDLLLRCLDSVRETVGIPYDLCVACQSTDGTQDALDAIGVEWVDAPAPGIAANRSTVIRRFEGYDHVFMLEDDTYLMKPGWIERCVHALDQSGYQFILGITDWHGPVAQRIPFPGGELVRRDLSTTQCMAFTGEVIRKVGYFAPEFGTRYGFEEAEWGARVCNAGLSLRWLGFEDAGDYIYMDNDCPPADLENAWRRNQDVRENDAVWQRLSADGRIYRPWPYG